jgi:hypothetical protein
MIVGCAVIACVDLPPMLLLLLLLLVVILLHAGMMLSLRQVSSSGRMAFPHSMHPSLTSQVCSAKCQSCLVALVMVNYKSVLARDKQNERPLQTSLMALIHVLTRCSVITCPTLH